MASTQSDTTLLDRLDEFLQLYCRDELAELAQSYPNDQQSLVIDFADLMQFDPDLADDYLEHPEQIRELIEESLGQTGLPLDVDLSDASVRVRGLPETRTHNVSDLRRMTVGESIALHGQVSNRTGVRIAPSIAHYECQRCGTPNKVHQDLFSIELQEPHECQGCERQGPFDLDEDASKLRNIQLARLALPPEQSNGESETTVDVLLQGDACGGLDAGDRVTVTGQHSLDDDSRVGFGHRLRGEHVEVDETSFQDIEVAEHLDDVRALANGEFGDPFDLLVESIAPSIIGNEDIKRSLVLQLFGGIRTTSPDGTSTRGDVHVLLIGDPGTAKSTFLEDIERKAPNALTVSGKGATAAGLTASAAQTDFGGSSEWSLDAGAMVLADGGVACVDEIDKVDDNALQSLHQALSKQRVSINKAGINTELPTRTAMLAAGNPSYGRFEAFESTAEQIDLSPTLLSRFDLIWTLDDKPDKETDMQVAEGMMDAHDQAIRYSRGDADADEMDIAPKVRVEVLRAWIAHAKQTIMPRWPDDEARSELVDSFVSFRMAGKGSDNPIPMTYRALESQRRLAEASARVRLSETVELQDVRRAREIYVRAMRDVGVDPDSNELDADVIETGTSKSQRETIKLIEDLVRDISQEYDAGAPDEVVIERAQENDISRARTSSQIGKLLEKGELYRPNQDELLPSS